MVGGLVESTKTVVTCYDMLDVAVFGGITDFTDGRYSGTSISYEAAQKAQADWLLDVVKCSSGKLILDIGCGYGRILETTGKRGAKSVGITLSPQQQRRCREKGLNVMLMDYKEIPEGWNNRFDGIIANGSLEHFVQVRDALNGIQDNIYRNLFGICHRILKPGGYFATTAIHSNQYINPSDISKGSGSYPHGSDNSHLAKILLENLGGWYPQESQLERCAKGLFNLEYREDGTEDYNITSEFWLDAIKKGVRSNPKVWASIAGKFLKNPRAAFGMLDTWLFSQSWMWQFRKREDGTTPTKLFRDIWRRID